MTEVLFELIKMENTQLNLCNTFCSEKLCQVQLLEASSLVPN